MMISMLSEAALLACITPVFGRTIGSRQVADAPALFPITLPSVPGLSGLSGPSSDSSVVKPKIPTHLGIDQMAYNFPSTLVASDPSPGFPVGNLNIPTQPGTKDTDTIAYNLQPGVVAPDMSPFSPVSPESTPQLGIDNNAPITNNLALDMDFAPNTSPAERLFLQARALLFQMKDRGCKFGLFGFSEDLTGLDFDLCGKTSDWSSIGQEILQSRSGYMIILLPKGKVLSLLNLYVEQNSYGQDDVQSTHFPQRAGILVANLRYWTNAVDSIFNGNNVISYGVTDPASFMKIGVTYFPGKGTR